MAESNKERVARALYERDCEGCEPSDVAGWRREPERVRGEYMEEATVAIDALADVDGIAAVLAAHQWFGKWECSCENEHLYEGERERRNEHMARHQAAAVVAWMRDRA